MNPEQLLTHFDRLVAAPDAIPRLRRFILDLGLRGKLIEEMPHSDVVELNGMASPTDWSIKSMDEIAYEIQPGFACAKTHQVVDGHVHLRTHNVSTEGKLNFDLLIRVDPTKIDENKAAVRRGDVIFNNTNSQELVGKTCLVDRDYPYAFSNHLNRIRLKSEIDPSFLVLYFRLLLKNGFFAALCNRWIGQAGINTSSLREVKVPVPPLAEQHRIVAKVDELMALCDRLEAAQAERESRRDRLVRASLHRLNQPASDAATFRDHARFHLQHLPRTAVRAEHIGQLRQLIRNLAICGRLVPQDSKDEPASQTLKRIRAEKEWLTKEGKIRNQSALPPIDDKKPFDIPAAWQWIRFGEVIRDSDAGWSPRTEPFPRSGDNWGVVKVSAVTWDTFRPEENKQLLPGVVPPGGTTIRKGDFLISRANTSELVAKCVIVTEEPTKLTLSDKTVRLDIAAECNKQFLRIVNNHAVHARSYYAEEASGTSLSMKNVSRPVIYALAVPLPPLAEQHRIVAKVDELMALCDRLETQLTTTQSESRRLLEAVLHEALVCSRDQTTLNHLQTMVRL